MKTMVRAMGIDDAPFEFAHEDVMVVGSLVRAPNYLEGILSTRVKVDGTDATEKLIRLINGSRFVHQARVIFTDGAALGGFNLVDLKGLWTGTGIPVVSVSRDEPDIESIRDAMRKHLPDWKERMHIIEGGETHTITTQHKPIFVKVEGMDIREAGRLLELFTVRGRLPEPIRISHMVAAGIVMGESRGRA